jgi:hypothetical protein
MKRVCIVGSGVSLTVLPQTDNDVVAYVPYSITNKEVREMATDLRLPYCGTEQVFVRSPQTIRIVPTLRSIKNLGRGVYGILPQDEVDTLNWPVMRSMPTELLSAYLVARALKAESIHWYFNVWFRHPEVPEAVRLCLVHHGVELLNKPQK